MRSPVGIACTESRCDWLDRSSGRCGLLPPVAPAGVSWIFALPGCAIAGAFARWQDAPTFAAARNRHVDDAALPGESLLEAFAGELAAAVRRDGPLAALDGPAAARLEALRVERLAVAAAAARADRSLVARIGGPVPAAGALVLVAIGLFFAAALVSGRTGSPPPPTPRGLIGATLRAAADTPPADDFRLEIRLDAPSCVGVWLLDGSGPVVRLFPPPAPPADLPWPLPPTGDSARVLPAAGSTFPPLGADALVVVGAGAEAGYDLAGRLAELPRDAAAIRAALPDAFVLGWKETGR